MHFFWNRRFRLPVGVLLAGVVALGVNTAVQPPKVETEEIVVGPAAAAVQGVEQKGYIAVPEGEKWEDLSVILKDPEGNETEVVAELDDNAGYFLFEAETDISGEWTVDELHIVEEGQKVVQQVTDTTIEVYETVEEAFEETGPQILADHLEEVSMLSMEEYRAAMANISAVDREGNFIPVQVRVRGVIEQDYLFFNDGQERSASEPILTQIGTVTVTLEADGAESRSYEIQIVGDSVLSGQESYIAQLGLGEANALFARALSSFGSAQSPPAMQTQDTAPPSESVVARLGGNNRYETAVRISGTAFSRTDYAILVNHAAFPDALASSSLTRAYNAPILYTNRDTVPDSSLAEMQRLGVKNVFLIGGEGVIGKSVERQLEGSYRLHRLWGQKAIDTSRDIAAFLRTSYQSDTALLANVHAPQDGLVAGAYASRNQAPIFYTERDEIATRTLDYLRNYKRVIIVGGEAVVSPAVARQLSNAGIRFERVSGLNRYETAADFAKRYFPGTNRAVVASGLNRNMVDALTGSVLGGVKNAPVILTDRDKLPAAAISYYNSRDIYVSYLLGGEAAVSPPVLDELRVWTATPPALELPVDEEPEPIRIMLDPGHGWNYNQGVNPNYFEGNQMMYFSYYLRLELEKYGFEVDVTRMPNGAYASPYEALLAEKAYAARNKYNSINNQILSLADRGQSAQGYDLLLSLHSNAPFDIAASELFDSVTNPNKELAEKLLKAVTGTFNHNSRGVKYKYNNSGKDWYGILRESKADHAFLIEHGFHTGRSDVSKLMDFEFLKRLAAEEAKVIADHYGYR